ncbi:hypothetical protein SEA_KELA_336 [Streptomyces phage Kela]|nr:hypothetical protein SEA_JUSTBECAUSE_338 [Streptomyces phage JustBecause]QJD53896.1 hypothetical protein SEA_KELA_336 [Streptomyces phage Kela]
MSTITVAQDIEDARERLTPEFDRLRSDMCGHFWEAFGAAAARYRAARSEGPAAREFAGIVRELERDARGSLASFPREIPAAPEREPWATMPTDGSERLTLPERITYAVIGAACVAVLLVMGWTLGLFGGSDANAAESPAPPAGVSATDDRERDLIIEGGYLAWQAWTECGNGPAACDTALRELNANPYGITVMEDGSLIKREDDPNRVTVSLSELPSGDCWWEVKNDGTTEALCR